MAGLQGRTARGPRFGPFGGSHGLVCLTTPTSCTPGAGSKSLLEATLHQAGADVIPSARDVGLLSTQTVAQPRTGEPSSLPWRRGRIAKSGEGATMTSIQPELWVENAREALAFYAAAFGATVLHLVGEGDEIVAQLGVGDAAFWIAPAASTMKRLDPRAIDGATSRTLLVVDDPDTVTAQAVRAGAKETSPVGDEHGWRLGRIIDPFGHEWEIGKPLGPWPPT
jgi:PhnB protein